MEKGYPILPAAYAPPESAWQQVNPMTVLDFRTIAEATRKVATGPRYSAAGLGGDLSPSEVQSAQNILVAMGIMAIVRGVAGYYVGNKMGRPVAGAITGSLFGPLGLGVLSFWRK